MRIAQPHQLKHGQNPTAAGYTIFRPHPRRANATKHLYRNMYGTLEVHRCETT